MPLYQYVCQACGHEFEVMTSMDKRDEAVCPKCGGEIITRKDDLPETIKQRLDTYHEQTEPLKGFYEGKGKLAVVNGEDGIENTTRLALEALGV